MNNREYEATYMKNVDLLFLLIFWEGVNFHI